jgi:hypothetical protein
MAVKELAILDIPPDDQRSIEQEVTAARWQDMRTLVPTPSPGAGAQYDAAHKHRDVHRHTFG